MSIRKSQFRKKTSLVGYLLLLLWCAVFSMGLGKYPGSVSLYIAFSIIFLAVLISSFCRRTSYGYLFLGVMLWLGFWLKLIVHLFVSYPFAEPIGYFESSSTSWDEVLQIASVGGIGVLSGRFVYSIFKFPSTMELSSQQFAVPGWYPAVRRTLWTSLTVVFVGIAVINALYGIQQSGLVPRTILIYPLNALVYFLSAYGFSLVVATFLWWDICLGRKVSLVICLTLLEAFVSTIAILSRATYIFHSLPQLIGLFYNRAQVKGWRRVNSLAVVIAFVSLLLVSQSVTNGLRSYYYSSVPLSVATMGAPDNLTQLEEKASAIGGFAIDRWIGVEGVMAVAAYPEKGWGLFFRQLLERPEIGKSTIYQEICAAHYRFMDRSKFQFASLPGPVAFFYSSGRLWMVFIGMMALALLVLASESIVFWLTANPILSALWGGAAANVAAQMGVAPRGLLIFFFQMLCVISAIHIVQSRWFSMKIGKIKSVTF